MHWRPLCRKNPSQLTNEAKAPQAAADPMSEHTGIGTPQAFPPGIRRRNGKAALAGLALAIALVFAMPVLGVFASLLSPVSETWAHLADTVLPRYIFNSIILVLGVGILVTVIGVGTAWLVTLYRFPGRNLMEWALILPLSVPAYVMAYTYTDFLQASGPLQSALRDLTGWGPQDYWFPEIRSLGGAIAMLGLVLYPYVYLLSRAAFLEQSICALEVGRTLGCTPFSLLYRVALPLARPAIIAGISLALMETLADFGTVSFFGVQTFTTGIVRAWFSLGDPVAAAQLSAALLSVVFLVIVGERLARREKRYHHTTNRYQRLPGYRLPPGKALAALTACLIPLCLGFLLPAVLLLEMSLEAGDTQFGLRFVDLVVNSVTLAAATAVLAVLLALLLAYANRLSQSWMASAASRIASIGYAIPGAVIAIAVMIPFARLDNGLDAWFRATFGVSTGLLLTGTIAALIFAYLVRFLTVSLGTVEASLGKIKPTIDDAARSLGQRPAGTFLRIHGPIMWGSLLTAGLMVFVDVMKELPATLIMRPFNFDTLAVQAYNLASDERLTEASTASLTIVAVGLLPVIILSRAISRARPGSKG